jgi:hypothetical protein
MRHKWLKEAMSPNLNKYAPNKVRLSKKPFEKVKEVLEDELNDAT